MAGQGRSMRQEEVQKVIHLLSSTEMSVAEIAERMSCSKSTVIAINRRFRVREYNGQRSRWLKVEREPDEPNLSSP
jgi:transposase